MVNDQELDAMGTVLAALTPLDLETRERVLLWVAGRLQINRTGITTPGLQGTTGRTSQGTKPDDDETLAELFASAGPKTGGQKALIVGYWKQIREGIASLDAQSINTELKHMGHHIPNITEAMNELQRQKPQLAVQLKKSGTTRQARKTYKITTEGVRVAEAMISGEHSRS
jgi:hypothetical protein